MLLAKVIGTVVATRKNSNLVGNKFLIIETLEEMKDGGRRLVAVDQVGAGIGELVLVALGSAARMEISAQSASVDAAIVGIVDNPDEIYIR